MVKEKKIRRRTFIIILIIMIFIALIYLSPKIWKSVSVINENPDLCFAFLGKYSSGQRYSCIINYAINKQDSSVCYKLRSLENLDAKERSIFPHMEKFTVEYCLFEVAKIKSDVNLCENTGEFKQKCLEHFGNG